MATKRIELEVDFIGGEGVLTAAEEKALSDFLKQRKKVKGNIASPKPTDKNALPITQLETVM